MRDGCLKQVLILLVFPLTLPITLFFLAGAAVAWVIGLIVASIAEPVVQIITATREEAGYAKSAHRITKLENELKEQVEFHVQREIHNLRSTADISDSQQQNLVTELKSLESMFKSNVRDVRRFEDLEKQIEETITLRNQLAGIKQADFSAQAEIKGLSLQMSSLTKELDSLKDGLVRDHIPEEFQNINDAEMVEGSEHMVLLQSSIKTAKKELRIVSAFIGEGVISDRPDRRSRFLVPLQECLRRGVSVTIVYGMDKKDAKRQNKSWQNAKQVLDTLNRSFPETFILVDAGDHHKQGSHAKMLIKDDDYVVVGSFNWLSYDGSDRRNELSLNSSNQLLVQECIRKFDKEWRPAYESHSLGN